jgi:biotin transport system substrate-specific component
MPALPSHPPVLADLVPAVRARNVVLVALGVLFTALLAQVAVPVPGSPVPITGQTLAVVLTAAALGPVRGVAVRNVARRPHGRDQLRPVVTASSRLSSTKTSR